MQVLEDQDQRPILGERLEGAAPGGEGLAAPVAAEALVGLEADQGAEVRLDPAGLDGILDRARDRLPEPVAGSRRIVLLEDPRLRLDDLGQRPERGAVAVRETTALTPADHVRLGIDDPPHLVDQPALADTGHADDGDELRDPLVPRSTERVTQQAELDLATDEPRPGIVRDVEAEARACVDDLPDRDRVRDLPLARRSSPGRKSTTARVDRYVVSSVRIPLIEAEAWRRAAVLTTSPDAIPAPSAGLASREIERLSRW